MTGETERYKRFIKEINELSVKSRKRAAQKSREVAQEARREGDEAFAFFFEGEAYLLDEDWVEAERLERKAVTLLPDISFILSNYASLLLGMGRMDDALELVDKAISKDPKNVHSLNTKGATLSELDRFEEALELYDKALSIDPENVHVLSNKGTTLSKLSRYEEAIECFDKALLLDPENVYILSHKGTTLSELDRLEEALKFYDKALSSNPDHEHALRNKGATLSALDRNEEAIECYEKSKKIQPWNPIDLSWIADIFYKLNKLEKAEETAKQLIDKLKKNEQSTKYAEYKLKRIKEKNIVPPSEGPEIAQMDHHMEKVLKHFGPEKLQEYLDKVEKKEEEFITFINSQDKSRKVTQVGEAGFLSILRKWNSYTPIITLDLEESKGGGYFLFMGGKGIVIDPGFDFIRNFFQEQFRLSDIDYIFVTHAHVDHMADLEALFSLLHRSGKDKPDEEKKKVDLFVNLGTMKKLSSWINLEETYINRIKVLDKEQTIKLEDLQVTATRAKHHEILDKTYSLGYVFEAGGVRVGFTGDTGWDLDGTIADPFEGCQVLVAHLGSILRKEIENKAIEKRLYKYHLGLLGLSSLIGKVHPDLCVISEFGEELGDLRWDVADGLSKALSVKCIAADVGTEVAFSNKKNVQHKIRCAICGRFKDDCRLQIKKSAIIYICKECYIELRWMEKLDRYLLGKRWELWDEERPH